MFQRQIGRENERDNTQMEPMNLKLKRGRKERGEKGEKGERGERREGRRE